MAGAYFKYNAGFAEIIEAILTQEIEELKQDDKINHKELINQMQGLIIALRNKDNMILF